MGTETKVQTDEDQKWVREQIDGWARGFQVHTADAPLVQIVLSALRRGRVQGLRRAVQIVKRKAGRNIMGEVIEPDVLLALRCTAEEAEKEAIDAADRP